MFKKLFLWSLLLMTLFSTAQTTVTYTESNSIIANPERGLQKYSKNYESGSYNFINQTTLTNWRNGTDKITVLYRYIMLTPFMNSTISASYLSNLQTDLDRVRNAGFKIILRPAYTDEYIATVQPNKAQIINHITQLSNIINTNKDIIISVQGGFIGVYGEWYYTGGQENNDSDGSPEFGDEGSISAAQWLNRKAVVDAMVSNFSTPIQLRYASAKKTMYGNAQITDITAYQNNTISKIGFYNDAFLNNYGDMGTYDVNNNCTIPNTAADYTYIANASQYLPMNGESNGINPCNGGIRTTGANAIVELNALNFSTLNRDYFNGVWNGWIASGHYNEIVRNLGYRLQLNSTTVNVTSTTIDFTLNITNTGYANVLTPKKVYLIFKNSTSEYKKLLSVDPRFWRTTHTFAQSLPKDIPDGDYQLYLQIADDALTTRAEYSIRLANSDIAFDTNGYNNLNQFVTISTLPCSLTTTWNGSSWSNGVPSPTVTAIMNGNYTVLTGQGFDCCNLIVNANVEINSNGFITVQNDITVNTIGTLMVRSGGKLIPVNDTSTSTGIVNVERTTTTMKNNDYTYWSSPTTTNTIGQSLPTTDWFQPRRVRFNTTNFYDIQTQIGSIITAGADGQDDNGNAWTLLTDADAFVPATGYATMVAPTGTFPRTVTARFTGVLNTGIISIPLMLSQNTADNNDDSNLVGNPYSSSIFAISFIQDNLPNISGTLSFWTHTGTLSSSYPGLMGLNFSQNDYAFLTQFGSTNAAFGGKYPSEYIASCQGFIVEAETTQQLVFKPSYMAAGYTNSTGGAFFRNAQDDVKKIWINISTQLGLYDQQLIGYSSDTDLEYNKGWDALYPIGRTATKFYSVEGDNKFKIQARGTFDEADVVKLGFFTGVDETFTITADSIVGIPQVFIRDNGVVHTLPYTFTSEVGEFNDRFELIYQNTLTTTDWELDHIIAYPNPTKGIITISLNDLNNYKVSVHNVIGQNIRIPIEGNILHTENLATGTYFIRIEGIDNRKTIRIIKK